MRPDARDLGRTAVRVALIAAGVGLLVLLLAPLARSQDVDAGARAAELMLDREPVTTEERVDEARELLERERERRMLRVGEQALELGLSASLRASPRRLLGKARRLAREVRSLDDRGLAEEEALRLLEPEEASLRGGDADGRELYVRLQDRERRERVSALARRVREQIDRGRLRGARRSLRRIADLDPAAPELAGLRERVARAAAREPAPLHVDPAEMDVAAALLAGHFEAAEHRPAHGPDARLAVALARDATSARAEALADLEALAAGEGRAAESAGRWLADPRVHPEAALDRAWSQARLEGWLGHIGGDDLARDGSELSRDAVRAWKASAEPLNLAVSVPARLASGYTPRADAYRRAAVAYLERFPEGPRAARVRQRLGELGAEDPDRLAGAFRDGRLELPATSHTRRDDPELVVTRAALGVAGALDPELPRAWLRLASDGCSGALHEGAAAHALLDALGAGVESGELRTSRGSGETLELLRRLDRAVVRGEALCARQDVPLLASADALRSALVEGGKARVPGAVDVARGGDDVRLTRHWRASSGCPAGAACIDTEQAIDGFFYARVETDGDVRVGARTGLQGASLALDMGRSGPRATVVVPVARWIGLGRWLPLEAQVDIDLGGVSVGPRIGQRTRSPGSGLR